MRLRPSIDPWRELVDLHERVEQAFRELAAPAQVELAWRPSTENIKLEVEEGNLWISGQKPEPIAEGRVARTERRYGRFGTVVPLPRDADYEAAIAELEQGVLSVTLPRRSFSRTHRIPIRSKSASD